MQRVSSPSRPTTQSDQGRPLKDRDAGVDTQQWLASIVESSDDAIIGKSLDGKVTSWNKGAVRIFGYVADDVIGQPISFLAWPGSEEDMPKLVEIIRRLSTTVRAMRVSSREADQTFSEVVE